ncbi:MAG: hypothetical protein ACOY94_21985 [Bacillota bacterium]
MNWWEETEARAHRVRTPAAMAETLWQRLQAAGVQPDLAYIPSYDLSQLHDLCADLIKLVDGLLLAADGDRAAIRRQGLALMRWAKNAAFWAQSTAPAYNQLIDGLDLEADVLALREERAEEEEAAAKPEEQAKLDGRYRNWHLLYERLDLKLASAGVAEPVQRGLARSLSRIYEECLVTLRLIAGLERETNPRFRSTARLLLQVNTTWHFDLGPYHLGSGEMRARSGGTPGLQTWLLLAFQSL